MVTNDLEEALPFAREVAPFFPSVIQGEHLDSADQKAEFGRFLQFVDQPLPLFLAQHGAFAFCVWEITTDRLARLGPGGFQFVLGHGEKRAAEPSRVEQNDLHPFALRAENLGIVNPFALPKGGVLRCGEKFHEGFLRCPLAFEFRTGIVFPVIMIIPGADDRRGGPHRGKPRNSRQLFVTLPQLCRIRGVGVDIVAREDEQLGLQSSDRIPNGLRTLFVGARSEGDAGKRLLRVRHEAGTKQRKAE